MCFGYEDGAVSVSSTMSQGLFASAIGTFERLTFGWAGAGSVILGATHTGVCGSLALHGIVSMLLTFQASFWVSQHFPCQYMLSFYEYSIFY